MVDLPYVIPRVAIGAAIVNEDDVGDILASGITHVINCRVGDDG